MADRPDGFSVLAGDDIYASALLALGASGAILASAHVSTAGSAIRFYYGDAHATGQPAGPTTAPTGLAMFAGDFQSIRRFAERDHANIVSWHFYGQAAAGQNDAAGHYAAHEATDVLAADIREFFGKLS